ncbi:ABC transporter permease [Arthrobacter sp. KNU40]|uniref:ABC transporter permease n=1 Tax=Arthrobacter sp. KNU40 TaxID=3447965 RepID=UPI003F5FA2D5
MGWLALGAVLIAAWASAVEIFHVSPLIMPTPGAVGSDLINRASYYALNAAETTVTAILGLIIGGLIAFLLAVLSWWSPLLASLSRPMVYIIQAMPMVAMIPALSAVMGYGFSTLATVTAIVSMFPIYVSLGIGLSAADATARMVLASLGATRWTYLRRVAIPSALPTMFVGVQLSAMASVLATFATEYLHGHNGLGGAFAIARFDFSHPATPWGLGIVASVISGVIFGIATSITRRVERVLS